MKKVILLCQVNRFHFTPLTLRPPAFSACCESSALVGKYPGKMPILMEFPTLMGSSRGAVTDCPAACYPFADRAVVIMASNFLAS